MTVPPAVAASLLLLVPRGPPVKTFTIDMVEYSFKRGQTTAPTLRVKVGDIVRISLNNKGAVTHEFMLFENPNMVVKMMKDVIKELQAQNLPEDEAMEEYEKKMAEMEDSGQITVAFEGADADLQAGGSTTIEFTATRPGTFTFVCLEVDGTYPDIHYDKGMHGQLIVEQ